MVEEEFVHLHVHSDHSLLDGACNLDVLLNKTVESNMSALALTDHGNLYGAVSFIDKANKLGVKPIIGCELYVAPHSIYEKKKKEDKSKEHNFHITLLAENQIGFKNLIKLVSKAHLDGLYYKPRVDKDLLQQYHEGLIALSGCATGELAVSLLQDNIDNAAEIALWYRKVFGENNYFIEIQNHGLENELKIIPMLIDLAKRFKIPLVATNDVHYINKEDYYPHDILLCIQTNKLVTDTDRLRFGSNEFYFKSSKEMKSLFANVPEAISNTVNIAKRCNVKLPEKQYLLPKFPIPEGFSPENYFKEIVYKGFEERKKQLEKKHTLGKLKHSLEEYEKRLKREIEIILKMNFASYFLIVSDFIHYAKSKGIPVGPGRGSAASSFVAYCMGITDVDPLEYDLLFERFLNPERITMPDIDIDFCADRRSEVIEYVKSKYGKENVAQIITFQTMQAKGAVKDVGRALNFKYSDRDKITKLIPNSAGITLTECINFVPQLNELMKDNSIAKLIAIANKLEGLIRNGSTHAAGIVIAPVPLIELLPLTRGKEGEIITQYDMNALERIGLLKMDFLGLSNLTIIDDAIKLIKKDKGIDINLSEIPLDDEEVFKLFSEGKTNGIFQFESAGMKQQLLKAKPSRFEDLIALNALYRPGPMQMIDNYCARKNGQVPIEYELPEMENILKETYGIMVYQEQVMQIASLIAGYSLGEADILRRAMGKKKKDIMQQQKEKFILGAEKKNIPKQKALEIFEKMSSFAEYGFNKSHSAAYAYLAYQTAYLKAYYPVQFMAALLSNKMGKLEEVSKYLSECKEMKIEVLPPDVNESDKSFTTKENKIRIGLAAVKNVGSAALDSILEARKKYGRFDSLYDFSEKVDLTKVNKRVIESLIKAGAFDSFGLKRKILFDTLNEAMEYGLKMKREKEKGQSLLFQIHLKKENNSIGGINKLINKVELEWNDLELLHYEKDTLGFYLSGHPLEKYREEIKEFTTCEIEELSENYDGQEVIIAGIIGKKTTKKTKKGDIMGIFELEDMADRIEANVFPSNYSELHKSIQENKEVIVKGKFDITDNRKQLIVSDIIPLEKAKESFGRSIIVKLPALGLPENKLIELAEIIKRHKGNCTFYLDFHYPDKRLIRIKAGEEYKVKTDQALIDDIERLIGKDSIFIKK